MLILFSLMFSNLGYLHSVKAKTLIVPTDFPSIQAAINNATDGDTIFVRSGVYYENIIVDKSVLIVGEDKNETIIDGQGEGVVVKILADNVALTNFTVRGSGSQAYDSGIFVESNFDNISSVIVEYNGLIGVCLNGSRGTLFSGNFILNNEGVGIFLFHSSNCSIQDNVVMGNNGGVRLIASSKNNVSRNMIFNDVIGGMYLFYSCSNYIFGNRIYNNKLYGLYLDSGDSDSFIQNIFDTTSNLRHVKTNGTIDQSIRSQMCPVLFAVKRKSKYVTRSSTILDPFHHFILVTKTESYVNYMNIDIVFYFVNRKLPDPDFDPRDFFTCLYAYCWHDDEELKKYGLEINGIEHIDNENHSSQPTMNTTII